MRKLRGAYNSENWGLCKDWNETKKCNKNWKCNSKHTQKNKIWKLTSNFCKLFTNMKLISNE